MRSAGLLIERSAFPLWIADAHIMPDQLKLTSFSLGDPAVVNNCRTGNYTIISLFEECLAQ
jgi:hypothetical protein